MKDISTLLFNGKTKRISPILRRIQNKTSVPYIGEISSKTRALISQRISHFNHIITSKLWNPEVR